MPPPRLPPPKHNFGNLVDTCKIFLSGLNTKTTEQMLRRLFEKIGDLTDVYVPVEPQTKKPRGFAFVTFTDSRDAFESVEKYDGCAPWSPRALIWFYWSQRKKRLLLCVPGRRSMATSSQRTSPGPGV